MVKNNRKEQLWNTGHEIVAAAPQTYIDVDVEADGIAGYGSMLSIGAVSVDGDSYYSEICPATEEYIASNRRFCEQHGLERERLLDEAPPLSEVMEEFHEWTVSNVEQTMGTRAVFAAFNAGFDWGHVDLSFARAGLKNPYGVAPFDIKSLMIAYDRTWDWSGSGKDGFPDEIRPNEAFTHHALEDARYQQKLHFCLAALLNMQYDRRIGLAGAVLLYGQWHCLY